MSDQSLGQWLRLERERRGIALRAIADETKVALPLLQGLEDDDVSRWPGGIFRRGFVRAYASAVGLDPAEVVARFEREHGGSDAAAAGAPAADAAARKGAAPQDTRGPVTVSDGVRPAAVVTRARLLGTAADLAVALVLGLGSAAAGSRLLWPVLLIAAYYAAGVILTGTSPMVALLRRPAASIPLPPAQPAAEAHATPAPDGRSPVRRPLRVVRSARVGGGRARAR